MKTSGTFSPWQNEIADKREFKEISAADRYWKNFWIWKNGNLPQENNIVRFKEAARG